MKSSTRYSSEVRVRAVRLVPDHQSDHDSQWSATVAVASKLGCTLETLRKWVRQAERDRGVRTGATSDARRRLFCLLTRGIRPRRVRGGVPPVPGSGGTSALPAFDKPPAAPRASAATTIRMRAAGEVRCKR